MPMPPALLIDGKALAARVKDQLKHAVAAFVAAQSVTPKLSVLRVGQDPASEVYVRNKAKAAAEVGILSEVVHKPLASQADVLAMVDRWNEDKAVSGILVQLPLLPTIDERLVLERIRLDKDVDAFHPHHAGLLSQGRA